MLNIPIAVQDALREGSLRKNYKMKVNDLVGTDVYTTLDDELSCDGVRGRFWIAKTGEYRFYNPNYNTGIYIRLVTPNVGEIDIADIEASGEENTEIFLTLDATQGDDYYRIYPFNWELPDDEYLQLQQYSETEYQRVYAYTIDNDDLVSESVKIDERMVTGKDLKFGLCEGSVLEFQYFNHPNINGKDVQVYLSAEYVDTDNEVKWYDIPMGWYSVDQCPMQWDTGIFKVTAYNKLKSKYLDAKANKLIDGIQCDTDGGKITLQTIQDLLLEDYEITQYEETSVVGGVGTSSRYLYDSPTFKINGSNVTYYPFVRRQYLSFHIDPSKRAKLQFDSYLEKLAACIYSLKIAILSNVQNASAFWSNFLNSFGYQTDCVITVIFGTGDRINGAYALSDEMPTSWDALIQTHGTIEDLKYLYNVSHIGFHFPIEFGGSTSNSEYQNEINIWTTNKRIDLDDMAVSEIATDDIESFGIEVSNLPEVTLRDLVTANYELHCQYGRLDRATDLFTGVELNQGGLYPADTLYPDNALYPSGPSLHPFPSTYQKLWTDTVGEQSFRYLIITYKAIENGEEVEKTLQRTVNTYGTTNYNMSDNWLFRNLVWTAEDVGAYADAMVLKMKDVRWFPFELWCAGLPYIETGDAIEITDRQGDTHTSYVLTRTLEGIHNLQDTFINGELDIF